MSPRATGATGELSHRQVMTILSALLVALFLSSLDQTIVSTAIRTIGDDLHGLSAQAWVTTSFLITSTISTPLFGKLSDIYGRKPFMMGAIVVFLIGSMLCGLAQNMYMLAGFRALQGIGAGGIMPLAMAIVGDIIPPRRRAKYQGYFVAVFSTSAVIGPVVGGFLAGQGSLLGVTGWRWIFYINIPIGLVAFVMLNAVLHTRHVRHEHRIDWLGAALLVVGLVPLLIVAEQGRTWGWGSTAALACYGVGVAGLIAFLLVERRVGDEALLPFRLFRSGTIALGSAHSMVMGMAMFGSVACLPLYLQIVRGATPTQSGLLMLPMVAGMMSAGLISGQVIMRTGRYKVLPVSGATLLVVGMLLLSRVGAFTPLPLVDLCMLCVGLGVGLSMQSMVLAMQNAVDASDMGLATSTNTFFRSVGGSLGTAVFLSVLFSQAASQIASRLAGAGVRPPAGGAISLDDTSRIATLPKAVREPILIGFSDALSSVFILSSCVAVVALILALRVKERPLRTTSAMAARREAAARLEATIEAAEGLAGSPDGRSAVAAK